MQEVSNTIEEQRNNLFESLDMLKDKNVPAQSRKNCLTAVSLDPELLGNIKYNTLTKQKDVFAPLPWDTDKAPRTRAWTNIDYEYLLHFMETKYLLASDKKVLAALEMTANLNKYNPFIDMLESVTWDGMPRVENLLPDFLGVEKSAYTVECMKLFMLAVISRVMKPGTKFDYMIVLYGAQGIGKSSFFRKLIINEDWYLEDVGSLYNEREVAERIQGVLVAEFNELRGMLNNEKFKQFISATSDKYRGAYQRDDEKRYRTCVFIGTTNRQDFLNDRTGNRRYLPIECGVKEPTASLFEDEEFLQAYFMQAWAEMYEIYKSGEFSLVLSKEMQQYVETVQEEFKEDDPWVGVIQEWLDNCDFDYVCNRQIAQKALSIFEPDLKQTKQISSIMKHSVKGWKKVGQRKIPGYGSQQGYERTQDLIPCENPPFNL